MVLLLAYHIRFGIPIIITTMPIFHDKIESYGRGLPCQAPLYILLATSGVAIWGAEEASKTEFVGKFVKIFKGL